MRIVFTWIVAFILLFSLIAAWYITQPIITTASNMSENITETLEVNRTGSAQTYTLLRLAANVGIPFLAVAVIIWAVISSQTEDWRGYSYG